MKLGLGETCHLIFSTLANPTRLAILELLHDGPKNVAELSQALDQEQSMISHNLKPLERCGFVFAERRKKQHFYSLNRETIEPIFKAFSYHAEKYCSTDGNCIASENLQQKKKKDASNQLYMTRY